jgi:predicted metal-dependent hydrolase
MWYRLRRRRKRRSSSVTKHYLEHKEIARELTHARLAHFNQFYNFTYKRVSIKNQRRCWGSCSALGNLNFNYKIQFLPPELQDYIIVHELCHLQELNHGQAFWDLVAMQLPHHQELRLALRLHEKGLAIS